MPDAVSGHHAPTPGGSSNRASSRPPGALPGADPQTLLDWLVVRPLVKVVVALFLPLPLGDMGLMVVGMAVGFAGASLFRFVSAGSLLAGSVALGLYLILTRAGGRLANLRGTRSRLGWIVSVLSDYIVGVAFAVNVAIHLTAVHATAGTLLAVVGMLSVLGQGMVADFFRNRYVARANPDEPNHNDLEETELAIVELRKRDGSSILIACYQIYAGFRRLQSLSGAGVWYSRLPPPVTDQEGRAYAERLARVALCLAYLGPTTHIALLGAFACYGFLPSYLWLRILAGNALLGWLYYEYYRRERVMAETIMADPNARW